MSGTDVSTGVRQLEVAAEYHGQRIDNFLFRTLKGVPRSRIYRLLRKGEVRVNRGRVKADHRLQTGDVVRIPPIRTSAPGSAVVPPGAKAQLASAILHEDRELLVLNKPAGLAVHGGSGLEFGVIEALRAMRPEPGFLELVHRLDRETSGCLLLARNPGVLRELQQAFRADTIEKHYLLLVRGQWNEGTRVVDAPLDVHQRRGGERTVTVDAAGKAARTRFRPVTLRGTASLLEATLYTGRTHQIRVHAASLGHPLAGDERYGDPEFNRWMAGRGLNRLFLHAHRLEFSLGHREYAFSAPLDDTLRQVLEQLEHPA